MDRLAVHIVATAVLTAALATIPTAVAHPDATASTSPAASTSAAPKPSPSPSPAASASPSTPSKKDAQPPQTQRERRGLDALPCADAYQVGATAYARWHGAIAFSVRQFYSPKCHARFGFAYPWLQFRVKQVSYDLGVGEFDVTHDAIDGARTFVGGAGGPYFWSSAVSVPAGTCTEGVAHFFFPDDEMDSFTAKFCH
ncbi:MAG TPA: hypothetical protein VGZ32_25590 [Actinocrinis sp.]|jgi:hypothetical protein|uniref:hypothetical protein n=1 Tax=Actinocrinis sp. TaxID=1920516 RepID=UPI002DDD0C64|nr:hypothetical protein [Actinocrinis sp.]HEV3173749.1 hypothetical protein [Actinocrinis sp.]